MGQAQKKGPPRDLIQEMVRRIVARFDPERIILFGSRARGDAVPSSDVDLLVVMAAPEGTRKQAREIGAALHDLHMAKDIVVTTPEDFAWRQKYPGTIERPAVLEGKTLYVRNGSAQRHRAGVGA